jgi:hypothetical protein
MPAPQSRQQPIASVPDARAGLSAGGLAAMKKMIANFALISSHPIMAAGSFVTCGTGWQFHASCPNCATDSAQASHRKQAGFPIALEIVLLVALESGCPHG